MHFHNCHLEAESSDPSKDASQYDVRWPPSGPTDAQQQGLGTPVGQHGRGGEPLNPAWTRHLPCLYGELPGTWLPYMAPAMQVRRCTMHHCERM